MKKNSTLKEVLIGIFLIGMVAQIVCLICGERHLYHAIGLWVGVFLAVGMAIHMQRSIEDGLDLLGDAGVKHMQKASVIRMLIACIVMAVVLYKDWGNPLTLLIGVMTLKLAAYMQPITHKMLEKFQKGGRPSGEDLGNHVE